MSDKEKSNKFVALTIGDYVLPIKIWGEIDGVDYGRDGVNCPPDVWEYLKEDGDEDYFYEKAMEALLDDIYVAEVEE